MAADRFLCRPIAFLDPQRAVHPSSWLDHIPFAFWIIEALRPSLVVELGCQSGNSYSAFAQAIKVLNLSTACYAVDTWKGDAHAGFFDESVFEEWRSYHDLHFSGFSQLIRSTFDEALPHFADGTIDLLHIDGYHTFEAVSHDFEAWRPKLSRRGVVLCHDINVREHDFGAWRFWEGVRQQYPSFEFHHGHGLGVVGVGIDLPEPVKWLLSLDAGDAAQSTVRSFFARLGSAIQNGYAAVEARREAAMLQLHATEADAQRRHQLAHAARIGARLSEAHTRIAALEQSLVTREQELQERSRHVEVLEQEMRTRDASLAQLERELQRQARTLRAAEIAPSVYAENRDLPTVLLVSHVAPWRPKAGNEYRVQRMLRWYMRQGYRVVPVIAPLPGEEVPRSAVDDMAAEFGNCVHIQRDGTLDHQLRDVSIGLAKAAPTLTYADLLGENDVSGRQRELLRLDRTFCHDAVISTVLQLQRAIGRHILQVEYIWMTRLLPLVFGDVLKIVDLVDVFSSIGRKVTAHGLRDVEIAPSEEGDRVGRADVAIAIQDDERREIEALAPSVRIITTGVDFDVANAADGPVGGHLLLVGSNNPRNCKGLRDFLCFAWPRVRRAIPDAELVVVGKVIDALDGRSVPGVTAIGPAEDVAAWYDNAALVINPVIAGTGLKIKTIEALCHFRRVVTWPTGVEGLDPRLAAMCIIATDWYEFAARIVDALKGGASHLEANERRLIAHLFAPETVYASLETVCTSFFREKVPVV